MQEREEPQVEREEEAHEAIPGSGEPAGVR
jgi:hypothetical protein